MSNTGQAWVTLVTNDSYALGALVLAQSLKRNNTIHQLAVLITPGVSPAMRDVLSSVFDLVKEVDVLDSKDAANLALLARPDLGITFTKLHCWKLTQYSKCVFLDADTLVIKNCDELFERDEISAAPDAGWPDCFNSGVFVFTPSENTFKSLLDFALTQGSFDGGDQGLLNMYFGDWATKDITKHLPFIYNMVATATYSYLPAFKAFGGNVKIAHFIGSSKPWLQALPGGTTLSSFLDLWWDIFLKDVSKKLKTDMIINCTVFEEGPQASKFSTPHPPPPTVQRHVFVDPWDSIQQKQPEQTDSTHLNTQDVIDTMVEHLKLTQHHYQTESHSSTADHHHYGSTLHNQPTYFKQYSAPNLSQHVGDSIQLTSQTHSNILNQQKKTQSLQHLQQRPLQNHYGQLYAQKEVIREEPLRRVESYENIPSTISPPSTPSCVEQTSILKKTEEPTAVSEEGGLAGALAGRQKDVIEDQWRRQSWEQGNIDYMGRDAFENIWKKISETVEDIKPPETPAPEVSSAQAESAPVREPEDPKTDDKTDSTEVETQQVSDQPVETPLPTVEQPQPELPKAEAAAASERVSPPELVASEEAPPAEMKKEEAPTAESSEPSVPPAEVALAPQIVEAKPEDKSETLVLTAAPVETPVASALAPEPPVSAEVIPAAEPTSLTIQPEATTGEPAPSAVTETAAKVPAPPSATDSALQAETDPAPPAATDPAPQAAVPQPPTPTTEVPPSAQPQQLQQPKDSTAAIPPSADKKERSPPKDDSKPPEPPKDGGAEKVAALAQEPAAPSSPSVPSPASPSAPEGTKVDTPQSPPELQALPAAETSTPPQTPVGDAPVPPKRSSKKGKAKK